MSTGIDVPGRTTEVLVLASAPVTLTRSPKSSSVEILNLGPNNIWAALNAVPVPSKSRRIQPGETWAIEAPFFCPIQLIAETADQVTGAATIVNEVRSVKW